MEDGIGLRSCHRLTNFSKQAWDLEGTKTYILICEPYFVYSNLNIEKRPSRRRYRSNGLRLVGGRHRTIEARHEVGLCEPQSASDNLLAGGLWGSRVNPSRYLGRRMSKNSSHVTHASCGPPFRCFQNGAAVSHVHGFA